MSARPPIVDIVVPVTPKGAVKDFDALPDRIKTPSIKNPLSPGELIERMDTYGIGQSIVPARRYGPVWGLDYAAVRDFVAAYPKRLFATAGIDPLERMDGVRRFGEAVQDFGFIGAHTYSSWSGVPADDRLYYPYYAKAEELGVPFQIECMAGKGSLPSMGHPRYIERVAIDFPDLKIVATHTGYPWERELVAVAEARPNVYIGCDALHPRYWHADLLAFIRGETYAAEFESVIDGVLAGTSQRVVFGSNYRSMNLDTALPTIEGLGFPDQVWRALMADNARALYGLPDLVAGQAADA